MSVYFNIAKDNTSEVLKALNTQAHVAMEQVGIQAERYAKEKCPVDTGALLERPAKNGVPFNKPGKISKREL